MKIKLLALFIWGLASSAQAQQDSTQTQQDSLTARSVKWNIFPVAYYTPETQFGFGVKLVHVRRSKGTYPSDRPTTFSPTLVYTTNKQILSAFTVDIWRKHNAQHIHGWVEFNDYPYVFFGVGNDTKAEDEEDYTSRTINVYTQYEQKITNKLYLGLRYDLKREWVTEVIPDGLLDSKTILGSEGVTSSGLGPVLIYDTRDNLFTPKSGSFHQALVQSYNKVLGGSSNFMRYRLDLRKYQSGIGPGVLAGQALFTFASGDVPFQFMSPLGGVDLLRGFLAGRFRDEDAIAFQADYRFPLFWRFGGAVFGAAGQVAKSVEDFGFNRFRTNGGGGLRARLNNEGMVVRGDVAFSNEGMYIYFAFSEAF